MVALEAVKAPDAPDVAELVARRRSLGLPQAQLAKIVGIDPSYLCRLERGKLEAPPQTLHARCARVDLALTLFEHAKTAAMIALSYA
jgi:predicted transcriptional regulator